MFIPKIKSIKNKIISTIMLVCVLTMTTGFAIVLIEDIAKIKHTAADQAALIARLVGESCVSAISFNYPEKAEKNLTLIGSLPGFENARIFNKNGETFAAYDRNGKRDLLPLKNLERSRSYVGSYLHLVEPIVYGEKNYGVIYLRVRPSIGDAVRSRVFIMGCLMLGLIILSWLLAGLVQKVISTPILQLAHTAEQISRENDYSLRLDNSNTGEMGILFDAFNSMLTAIQQREIKRSVAEGDLRFKEHVIESTISCIATADLRGTITYANPSFYKMFGFFAMDEVVGKSFARFLMTREEFDGMLSSLTNQELWTLDTRVRKKDGTCFDAIISADTIRDAGEIPVSLVITVSDVSELRRASREMEWENWLKSGQGAIYDQLRGEQEVKQLANNILRGLKGYMDFQVGAVYVASGQNTLSLAGSYALNHARRISHECMFGEGLAGQAAVEQQKILVSHLPEDYVWISSGVGRALPRFLLAMPFIYGKKVKGVVELAGFNEFGERELELLDRLKTTIAIAIHTAQAREQVQQLLEKTQAQSEELQVQTEELQSQQEELRNVNQELEEQTIVLLESEKRLQAQQEELQQTNEELEEQRDNINRKNEQLERARSLVEKKAADLEITSRYKSEFLANMSHELRTPLNSILLLSDVLMENREEVLSQKHVSFAENIHASGKELLELINDILDLSKVESGKIDIVMEDLPLKELMTSMERNFVPVAREKGLSLVMDIHGDLPRKIRTDRQKVEQVLKNLLSNAFKFTEKGKVSLILGRAASLLKEGMTSFDPETTMVFSVEDTGIGILEDKQSVIFEAFMQEDGTTSRKYGGTGLGLSISREIARLLGGELGVTSRAGRGSTFFLALPNLLPALQKEAILPVESPNLQEEVILPIESSGVEEKIIPPAEQSTLQGKLLSSLESDRLLDEAALFLHQVETSMGQSKRSVLHRIHEQDSILDGKHILLVDDDMRNIFAITTILEDKGMVFTVCNSGRESLESLDKNPSINLVLMDMMMPEMDGYQAMVEIRKQKRFKKLPIIAVTAKAMKGDRSKCIEAGASDYLAKPIDRHKLLSIMRVWLY